jgi:DNA-binding NarL/FixJ family response regulator
VSKATPPWTVVIADDHPLVLRGLAELIGSHGDFAIFGRASNGTDALTLVREQRPDVAVLDVYMPGLGGIEILSAIKNERLPTRVVLLTASFEDDHLLAALELGAHGILLKEAAPGAVLECLERVAGGGRWLAAELVQSAARPVSASGSGNGTRPLTVREVELVRLVAEGLSNKDIGRRLSLTEGTVKSHLHHIYAKLGIANRASLVAFALGKGGARIGSR